ncbi:hypothetical protein [Burkholderia ubonensis]|uniref:hypothetical protein n=1 Tax=Burkholderia ubonensis TaxID=101571 RepID=UPI0018DFD549|nr:hypothetical protein [Burkholderia ubonensis]
MLTHLFERAAFAGAQFHRVTPSVGRTMSVTSKLSTQDVLARRADVMGSVSSVDRTELEDGLSVTWAVVARLADEVFGLVSAHVLVCIPVLRELGELVVVGLRALGLEGFDRFLCVSKFVFESIDFVSRTRLLLLQRESSILDIDDTVVDRLLHFGKLQFISRRDCCFCKVDSVLQAGDRGRDSHDWHLVSRVVLGRAFPRRNHHSACVSTDQAGRPAE